jgi:hypothetical protein
VNLATCLLERGTVGLVEDAFTLYTDGTQSAEPIGWDVHWARDDSRGEIKQFVGHAYLVDVPGFKPEPGDPVFCLTSLSGGLVLGVVIRDVVVFNCSGLEDDEVLALAGNQAAVTGGALPLERP